MKKKKVSAPVYEEMQDTPYITGLREDLPTFGLPIMATFGLRIETDTTIC